MTPNEFLKRIADCKYIKEIDYENELKNIKTEALIRANIFLCHPNTIFFYELQKPNHYTLSIVEKYFKEYFKNGQKYNLILDLSRAKKPEMDVRDKLKSLFTDDNIKMAYVYVGENIILKLFAKFIIGSMLGRESLIFVSSREEAYNLSRANAN